MLWVLLMLFLLGKNGGTPTPRPELDWEPPSGSRGGVDLLRELGAAGGLTEAQVEFLSFVAYGESGLNPVAGLGTPSLFPAGTKPNTKASASAQANEAKQAGKAYDRTEWVHDCPHPRSHYAFGSGGLFAMLPVYAVDQFKGTELQCVSPFQVFDPAFAIAAAYGFARGLTQRSGYLGTFASLRSGWGWPAAVGDLQRIANKSPKWRKHLKAIGLPAEALNWEAPAFPRRDLVAMYRAMGGQAA